MNAYFKFILPVIAYTTCMLLLAGGLSQWKINPGEWDADERKCMVAIWGTVNVIATIARFIVRDAEYSVSSLNEKLKTTMAELERERNKHGR